MFTAQENVTSVIEAWKLMVGRLPTTTIQHADGVATIFGHVPMGFLNLSMPDHPLTDADEVREALAIAKERAKACEYPSYIGLCDDLTPQGWEQVAAQEGLKPSVNLSGMATDRLLPPRRPAPEVEFHRVTNDALARDLATINAQAYELSMDQFECICNMHLWHADTYGFVGFVDGRAVTTASMFPVAGTRYVAYVATLPEWNGRGYAEAAIRHAIEQSRAAMGEAMLVLHASDAGRPLYKSMGFEPATGLNSPGRITLLAAAD